MKKTNKILVVVDMQNDFITGALPATSNVSQNIADLINDNDFDTIIFTQDTHKEDYLETQEGKKLPVPHCIKDTQGWEIVPELAFYYKDAVKVEKPSFGSKRLAKIIKQKFTDAEEFGENLEVVLVGVCTDICVVSNALLIKAFVPEVEVTVNASCCAGTSEEAHNAALKVMQSCQINILNS